MDKTTVSTLIIALTLACACGRGESPKSLAMPDLLATVTLAPGWKHEGRAGHHEFFVAEFVENAHPRVSISAGTDQDGRRKAESERAADIAYRRDGLSVSEIASVVIGGKPAWSYEVAYRRHDSLAPHAGKVREPVPVRERKTFLADGSLVIKSIIPTALSLKYEAAMAGMVSSIRLSP